MTDWTRIETPEPPPPPTEPKPPRVHWEKWRGKQRLSVWEADMGWTYHVGHKANNRLTSWLYAASSGKRLPTREVAMRMADAAADLWVEIQSSGGNES